MDRADPPRPARRRLGGSRRTVAVAVAVAAVLATWTGVALAKSGSRPIPPPPADTVVCTLSLAGEPYEYTWADVSGDGKLGSTVTQSYLLDPQSWTGIWLRRVLADVEARSDIVFDDDWKLRITAVDGYVCALWVGDVKDATYNYLLAMDPAEGCTTEDPDDPAAVFYEPTYVRVCTNGDYGNTAFPARLVKAGESMTVLDGSGHEIRIEATKSLKITSPTVSQAKATVAKKSKLALRATTTKAPGAIRAEPVVWTSGNTSVATVASGTGTVTARRAGTATITATSGSHAATFTVKVVAKAVNARKIALPASRSLTVGSGVSLTAKLHPSTATNTITWKSGKPAVARVDRAGRVSGLRKGKTTITVKTSNGKTAKCVVTVK